MDHAVFLGGPRVLSNITQLYNVISLLPTAYMYVFNVIEYKGRWGYRLWLHLCKYTNSTVRIHKFVVKFVSCVSLVVV